MDKIVAEELHKTVIKKVKRRKIYERFKDKFWAENLAEMSSYLLRIEY